MLLNILKKSDKLGIDNRTLPEKDLRNKIMEEAGEVIEALGAYENSFVTALEDYKNGEELALETLDLIQVCILVLYRLELKYPDIVEKCNTKHLEKLAIRGWESAAKIKISVEDIK